MNPLNKKKQALTIIISILVSIFLVATATYAVTTIGNNVLIGGTLEVTGTTTIGDLIAGTIASGTWNGTAIDISGYTNLVAGRSLTMSGDSVEADAELYTDNTCIYIEDPTASDDLQSIWMVMGRSITFTEIKCESDQTIDFDLQVDDGSPADVLGTDLQCAAGENSTTTISGDANLADGEELDLVVTSVSGTPTWVSICWTYTYDD